MSRLQFRRWQSVRLTTISPPSSSATVTAGASPAASFRTWLPEVTVSPGDHPRRRSAPAPHPGRLFTDLAPSTELASLIPERRPGFRCARVPAPTGPCLLAASRTRGPPSTGCSSSTAGSRSRRVLSRGWNHAIVGACPRRPGNDLHPVAACRVRRPIQPARRPAVLFRCSTRTELAAGIRRRSRTGTVRAAAGRYQPASRARHLWYQLVVPYAAWPARYADTATCRLQPACARQPAGHVSTCRRLGQT